MVAFIDTSKHSDLVTRSKIWEVQDKKDINGGMCESMKSIHKSWLWRKQYRNYIYMFVYVVLIYFAIYTYTHMYVYTNT